MAERNGSCRPAICGAEYYINPSAVLQPSYAVPVPVSLARPRTVLVVLSGGRVDGAQLRMVSTATFGAGMWLTFAAVGLVVPLAAVIPLAVISRAVSVAVPPLLLGGERLRDKARDTMILTWAGLRGGISIALALNAAQLARAHGFIGRDLRRGNFHHCRAGIGDLAFPAGPLTERNGSPRRCTSYFNALGFDFCWYAACELFPQAWS